MPTVPRYSPQVTAQADALPYRSPTASATSFGALTGKALENVGDGLQEVGHEVGKYVAEVNQENINREAKDAFNSYSAYTRNVLYGDGTDQNKGLLALNGHDAIDAYPEAAKLLSDKRQEMLDAMTNRHVKDAFNSASSVTFNSASTAALSHVNTQREAANDASSKATIASATSDAALAYNDPETLRRSSALIDNEVRAAAARKGFDTETTDKLANDAVGKMYDSAMDAAIDLKDFKTAEKLFNEVGTSMNGIQRAASAQKLFVAKRQAADDALRTEHEQDRALEKAQKRNTDLFVVDIANNKFSPVDATRALQKGQIDFPQYENLVKYQDYMKNEKGDQNVYNKYLVDLFTDGSPSMSDIMEDKRISGNQKTELIKQIETNNVNGGIFNTDLIKQKQEDIQAAVTGQTGALVTITDPDKADKYRKAVSQYRAGIMGLLQTGQPVNPGDLNRIRDEAISAWSPRPIAVISDLSPLPFPSTWQGNKMGDKPTLVNRHRQALAELERQHDNGLVSDDAYITQHNLLDNYDSIIQRMQAPTVGK